MRAVYRTFVFCAIMLACAGTGLPAPAGIVAEQREKGRGDVTGQRAADRERIERISKEMKAFIDGINESLGFRDRFRGPVDIEDIEDIEAIDHIHSKKKPAEREYAFVTGDRVAMRTEGSSRAREIGFLGFRERVELLARTGHAETVQGVSAPWVLVRRSNGDEGWVFGAFLGNSEPDRKEDFGTLDRKGSERRFSSPVEGAISSRYGYRVDPKTKRRASFHRGIDIVAPVGTPVRASAGGTVVIAAFNRNEYGNLVVIEHEKELATYYGHLNEIRVEKGRAVQGGEVIGTVGRTGRTTGPHLHFEVRRGGTACDPEQFLR